MVETIPLTSPASRSFPYGMDAPCDANGTTLHGREYHRLDLPPISRITLDERATRPHALTRVSTRSDETHTSEYWGRLAQIAYRRFPGLGKGESFQSREFSARLAELRAAGYDVPAYSHLGKEQKWELLRTIKHDVRDNAHRFGAGSVLRAIAQRNEQIREEELALR